MKLFSIVLLLLIASHCYSQTITDKSFAFRNGFQEINYNGKNGNHGNDGAHRFAITLFHMAKRGANGKPGKQGPALQVKVSAFHSGDSSILLVTVTKEGGNKADKYYVNPRHGKLSISANGGDGEMVEMDRMAQHPLKNDLTAIAEVKEAMGLMEGMEVRLE